jgi:hypothetical protein
MTRVMDRCTTITKNNFHRCTTSFFSINCCNDLLRFFTATCFYDGFVAERTLLGAFPGVRMMDRVAYAVQL